MPMNLRRMPTNSRHSAAAIASCFLSLMLIENVHAATPRSLPIQTTPPFLQYKHVKNGIAYRVRIRPSVTQVGQTTTVEISLSESTQQTSAGYGRRRPLQDASLRAILVGHKNNKTQHHHSIALPDQGSYGVTFTPRQRGMYTLYLRGNAGGKKLAFHVPVSVDIWPLPQHPKQRRLPKRLPRATAGNIAAGKALCKTHCKHQLAGVLPERGTVQFIPSAFAAATADPDLLRTMLQAPDDSTPARAQELSPLQHHDLLLYLRSRHWHVRDFFPRARVFMAHDFQINAFGLKRLHQSMRHLQARQTPTEAKVFVIYGSTNKQPLEYIEMNDRLARQKLSKAKKVGYLLFFNTHGQWGTEEIGIALGPEPHYRIRNIKARDRNGRINKAVTQGLQAFVGQGKFNQPKSLRGAKRYTKKLVPLYLTAAELATMYYSDEREFTAFDRDFEGF